MALHRNAERAAFARGVAWLSSELIVQNNATLCPTVDGSDDISCVMEGLGSMIAPNGDQPRQNNVRLDCNCETAVSYFQRRP
jgi:hypothetical protein